MRSVSSANNLRKVHAKKEAEKAEAEGRTPTSARSLAPANSNSLSEDENASGSPGSLMEGDEIEGEEQDPEHRHREFMSRIYPSGVDSDVRNAAERFFPRHDHQDAFRASEDIMKTEPENEERHERELQSEAAQNNSSTQMTDVVMREMADAQAEAHETRQPEQDSKMSNIEDGNEQQETERYNAATQEYTAGQIDT